MVIPPEIPKKKRIFTGLFLALGFMLGVYGVISEVIASKTTADFRYWGSWFASILYVTFILIRAWRNRELLYEDNTHSS